MEIKEKTAPDFLEKTLVHNIDMIEPIRRGTAEILYATEKGVVIRETESGGAYAFHERL